MATAPQSAVLATSEMHAPVTEAEAACRSIDCTLDTFARCRWFSRSLCDFLHLSDDRVAIGHDRVAIGHDRVAIGQDRVAIGHDLVL
jgi:hypothetical protein